jgi:hypothetical protein
LKLAEEAPSNLVISSGEIGVRVSNEINDI